MASTKYLVTDEIKLDIENVTKYLREVLLNPQAAKQLIDDLHKTVENIVIFPNSRPALEEVFIQDCPVRKAIIKGYILYYIYDENAGLVTFLRFVSVKRDNDSVIRHLS